MTGFEAEVSQRIAEAAGNEALRAATAQFMSASIASKYSYNFSWLGRPIIQYPQDMVAMQELIWTVKPDLIIETGIAHGGSLILSASMLALRVAVAVAHGTFFGVAMVVAVGLVREDQRGRAVALILSGLTVSNIVGVPAGTAIGNVWGWRATFWVMGALGVAAAAAMAALLPRTTGTAGRPAGLAREVRVLGRQQVWTSLIVMLMLMIGQFGPYTYIAPMLQEVTGLGANWVPWVLLLNGVGATVGVFVGGRLSDWKLMPSLIVMLVFQTAMLAALYVAGPYKLPMIVAIFLWGGLNFSIGTAVQTRILGWTADAAGLASSLIPAGFNVGIALAASLGAAVLDAGYGYRSLPLFGAAAMAAAVAVGLASYLAERRSGVRPPVPATAGQT